VSLLGRLRRLVPACLPFRWTLSVALPRRFSDLTLRPSSAMIPPMSLKLALTIVSATPRGGPGPGPTRKAA
jgi:hypothetical protein